MKSITAKCLLLPASTLLIQVMWLDWIRPNSNVQRFLPTPTPKRRSGSLPEREVRGFLNMWKAIHSKLRMVFFGLVERCTAGQQHEFPFFEPRNGRRRMRQLYVRPGVGRAGFVEAMARRWGPDTLRCSRSTQGELYPHYFEAAIEGHIELHLDPQYPRLPGDSFFVRACYDIDSEAELAAFVEPLLLPGGGPHEFMGEPIW
jgi:hypothetical protein